MAGSGGSDGAGCGWLRALALAAPLPALTLLGLSAVLARGWWSFWDNAFSDLGNPRYDFTSSVLFNLGLYTSSVMLLASVLCLLRVYGRIVALSLAAVGFSLGLVAVFSEVYGRVHFIVSAAFFISILVFTLAYSAARRSPRLIILAVLADFLSVLAWYSHLAVGEPPGAAPPELLSVIVLLAFYYHALGGAR